MSDGWDQGKCNVKWVNHWHLGLLTFRAKRKGLAQSTFPTKNAKGARQGREGGGSTILSIGWIHGRLKLWLLIVHKEGSRVDKGREGEVKGETMTICSFIPWSNAKGVGVCDAVWGTSSGYTAMFIFYYAIEDWGWECLPNEAREEKPIANCHCSVNIPRVLCRQLPLQDAKGL